ncbi:MAG: DNA topoisomerase I [Gammaproteobacteria bacterium]|nr:DNA topoisomerase I [Gammaproteobacteria bacterium]
MASNLVIVESPAKASTIKKYLGDDFEVLASYGHVRDLLPKEGAVDTEHDFGMRYEVIDKNSKYVDAITRALKKAKALYLATDLDREGEAISWHLVELMRDRDVIDGKAVRRVVFHEITPRAIREAMEHPREISMDLVNAQQARRALDYLVGFNLSPLLWKKIKRGLSAGRVQSPALRLICEREAEIESFKPREYWTVEADADSAGAPFNARLNVYRGEKMRQFSIENSAHATRVREDLIGSAGGKLTVSKVERKQRRRNPAPPFITSTLQQEAVRKLGFTAQRAMRIAQQLYEGIDVGFGSEGLITYMRTDSLNLAQEAIDDLRGFIRERFGPDEIPAKPHFYKTSSKNAQEAHEAIRPTSIRREPALIKARLSSDQYKLYDLIWKRTVACQMIHATIDTVTADLDCGDAGSFRATGTSIANPGFIAVYTESTDDQTAEERMLPPLEEGQVVSLREIRAEQHFTEPPPRYSEASLVKSLEEFGIGRPSTYASIISTLLQREYVELDKKRFRPTDIGRIVINFLTSHFTSYVDYDFTARLEDELDAVSRGEKDWIPVLREFWDEFHATIQDKEANVSRKEATQARLLGEDPKTGKPVSARMGRFGPYVIIGNPEDEEKPQFFGLKRGQRLDTITLEEALELTKLPRHLGAAPDGLAVSANIGRFGPYIRHGEKFVSLKGEDDPYTITMERALELIEEKRLLDAAREIRVFQDAGIRILNGRFGPYVTDGGKNARVPKDRDPAALSQEECVELLANAKPAFGGRGRKKVVARASVKAPAAPKPKVEAKAKAKPKTKAKPKAKAKAKAKTGATKS